MSDGGVAARRRGRHVAHVRRDHHHRRRRVVHRPTLERAETVKRQDIYDAIGHERDRQARLWSASHAWGEGDCSSPTLPPIVKSAVLAEECGEVARAVLEHDAHNLPRELIQVAAVAVAWLESM